MSHILSGSGAGGGAEPEMVEVSFFESGTLIPSIEIYAYCKDGLTRFDANNRYPSPLLVQKGSLLVAKSSTKKAPFMTKIEAFNGAETIVQTYKNSDITNCASVFKITDNAFIQIADNTV